MAWGGSQAFSLLHDLSWIFVVYLRYVIDNVAVCATQRAVLRVFSDELHRLGIQVQLASELSGLDGWEDVPFESARRLALRMYALRHQQGLITVFLPGHIVPALPSWNGERLDAAIGASPFTALAELDVFVAANDSSDLLELNVFSQQHPDYESISRYNAFHATALPQWLNAGNGCLVSCLRLTDRPWYSIHAATRPQWMEWIRKALDSGYLSLAIVREDYAQGLIRPSLLLEIESLYNGAPVFPATQYSLDTAYVVPECCLTPQQYAMLHSKELHARTLQFTKTKVSKKQHVKPGWILKKWPIGWASGWLRKIIGVIHRSEKIPRQIRKGLRYAVKPLRRVPKQLRRIPHRLRQLPKQFMQMAYSGYCATGRPFIRRALRKEK